MVDEKLAADGGDGYRDARLAADARGLAARARGARCGGQGAPSAIAFMSLARCSRMSCLTAVQSGEVREAAWRDMPPDAVLSSACCTTSSAPITRIPTAWNEIGFGGPASPRGYVRMNFDRRDPWEAVGGAGRDARRAPGGRTARVG